MTDEEAEALGRRLLAAECPWLTVGGCAGGQERYNDERWPDLRDVATKGAALEALREKTGRPALHLRPCVDHTGRALDWHVYDGSKPFTDYPGGSEAKALVLAWEAA